VEIVWCNSSTGPTEVRLLKVLCEVWFCCSRSICGRSIIYHVAYSICSAEIKNDKKFECEEHVLWTIAIWKISNTNNGRKNFKLGFNTLLRLEMFAHHNNSVIRNSCLRSNSGKKTTMLIHGIGIWTFYEAKHSFNDDWELFWLLEWNLMPQWNRSQKEKTKKYCWIELNGFYNRIRRTQHKKMNALCYNQKRKLIKEYKDAVLFQFSWTQATETKRSWCMEIGISIWIDGVERWNWKTYLDTSYVHDFVACKKERSIQKGPLHSIIKIVTAKAHHNLEQMLTRKREKSFTEEASI
jgi:hypothetical protein